MDNKSIYLNYELRENWSTYSTVSLQNRILVGISLLKLIEPRVWKFGMKFLSEEIVSEGKGV